MGVVYNWGMAKRSPPAKSRCPASRAAEEYGCDLSLIENNLKKSVQERIRQHSRALATALALRQATIQLKTIQERKPDA